MPAYQHDAPFPDGLSRKIETIRQDGKLPTIPEGTHSFSAREIAESPVLPRSDLSSTVRETCHVVDIAVKRMDWA